MALHGTHCSKLFSTKSIGSLVSSVDHKKIRHQPVSQTTAVLLPVCHESNEHKGDGGEGGDDNTGLWGSDWSVGGSRLCVHGKHPGCSRQSGEADGSQGETHHCAEWHPEIITSNQSGAGSADRLRLMAPDCCLTALNKWGEENRATEQQNGTVLSISHSQRNQKKQALSVLALMCGFVWALCVC